MKTLLQLGPNECRYPMTRDPPHFFCAADTDGRPYCPTHDEICVLGYGKPWQAIAAMVERTDQGVIAGPIASDQAVPVDVVVGKHICKPMVR